MPNKIKVLEVIRQGQIGGGETHVLDLIKHLNKKTFTPIALAFSEGHMINELRKHGITCYVINSKKAFDPKTQPAIWDIVSKEKIDIIHAHGSRAASNMLFVAKTLRKPLVYTVHGWSFHQDQTWLIHKLRILSEKLICHSSNEVICVSKSNYITGKEAFGLEKCNVIENGINLNVFNYNGRFRDIRPELGFTSNDFIIAEICRITAQKAPLDFLKSVEIAHQKDERIKGLLVGEGELENEVMQYIDDHKMASYITRTPFRTDIPEILNAIDLYALPSLWEGLSIALLEAIAMKKTVIVTPTDGCKEIITNGINGTIVPFNNPKELAQAYLKYLNEPELMNKHRESAYTLVRDRFNARKVADSVQQIYESLIRS